MDSHLAPVAVFLLVSALLAAGGMGAYWLLVSDDDAETAEVTVSLAIDFGDGEFEAFIYVDCADATPLGALLSACERRGIEVETAYYELYGSTMVVSIGGAVNGDGGRYWQYYVNGEMPMESADSFSLSNGDTVIWSFEVPEWT